MTPHESSGGGGPTRGKVLVIDDSPNVLATAELVLESEGFTVITCKDAWCSHVVMQEQPDLILMDVKLAGLRGDRAGKALLEVPGLVKHGLIVFHSNLPETELMDLVRASGVAGYMPKAQDPATFVRQVEHWIALARAGRTSVPA